MRHRRRARTGWGAIALLAAALLAGCASASPKAAAPTGAGTVIIVSLDGVRHDYPDRAAFPALDRIAREGLRANRLVPVYPSTTFPGHVSLATGTYPDVHGIVDNEFWDRARGERFDYENDADWIEAEPLWAAAERQGVIAATFFWVGSDTDWHGIGAHHRRAPFDPGIGEAEKVAQILAWLDLPEAERPRLVMTWWHGADRAGHQNGPDSPEVAAALAEQDHQLGVLLAGLDARAHWADTTLFVVSDHGMTTAEETVPLERTLREVRVDAHVELGSAIAHVFVSDPEELARAERVLRALPGVAVDRRETLPPSLRLGHPMRTGDLVVRAQPGFTFRSGGLLAQVGDLLGRRRGLHGYPPDQPDMGGIFFAIGRGVSPGARPGDVRMVDVAPTAALLLGIDPPRQSEGRPIAGFPGAS